MSGGGKLLIKNRLFAVDEIALFTHLVAERISAGDKQDPRERHSFFGLRLTDRRGSLYGAELQDSQNRQEGKKK